MVRGGRRTRDRHGRGRRGPDLRPGPRAPHGVPAQQSPAERFDELAMSVLDEIESRWVDRMPPLDLAVEEVPAVPLGWTAGSVPLGSLVPATATTAPRIVLFRRPIEHRAGDRVDLAAIVLAVIVDQVAELIGVPPSEVHPDYPSADDD